jgi:parallel beta-helix repeat protein
VNVTISPFTVQITSPAQGSTFRAGTNLLVTAKVSNVASPVSVDFYVNGALTGIATNSPYSITNTPNVGSNQLVAIAVDRVGDSVTSAPVNVTISPFTVQITSPAQGSTFPAGTNLLVTAGVSNVLGPVSVNFYVNGALAGAATNSPYKFICTPTVGSNQLVAIAVDRVGDSVTSAPVNVTISPFTVQITSPAQGSTFPAGTNLLVTAAVANVLGPVSVNYYVNGAFAGAATSAPYSAICTPSVGSDQLVAIAVDQVGNSVTSAPVNVTISPFIVQITSPAQGSTFPAGTNLLVTAAVVNVIGPVSVNYYVNGAFAGAATSAPYAFAWNPVSLGAYQLVAIAVDQAGESATSAQVNVTIAPPIVQITSPAQGSIFPADSTLHVIAAVGNVVGAASVNFYVNGAPAAVAANAPYTFAWNPVTIGNYQLTASCADSLGNSATSAPVSVTITSRPPATISFSVSSDTIYVGGGGQATLTDIASALPGAPLSLMDPTNLVWFLGATIVVQDGSLLSLHGSADGGDVNELLMKSDNPGVTNNYIWLDANWGELDLNSVKVISWNEATNGPYIVPPSVPRAFIRARSSLVGTNVQESRLDVRNSEVGWLGFGNSESYGLTWEVVSNAPGVNVFGVVSNSYIHDCALGVGTWSGNTVSWTSNEIAFNVLYGLDTNNPGVQAVLAANYVHDNTLGATFGWSSSDQRIYIGGPGNATLSDIKTAIPNAPVCLIDPTNDIWFLSASLVVTNGATLLVQGSAVGGDANEVLMKSDDVGDTNSYVWIDADWGTLDFQNVKVISWNELVAGPDTDYTSFPRAFIRARSRLLGTNVQQSTLSAANSEFGWLGYNSSDGYGLNWQVVGSAPGVTVFGTVSNCYIHNCQLGVGDWYNNPKVYGNTVLWTSNTVTADVLYGFDPINSAQKVVLSNNNVYGNSYAPLFRWSSSNQRIYVTGNGTATLSDITNALPNAPLTLVDPTNLIWYLTANLWVNDGAQLKLYGPTLPDGNVGTLRIYSNHALGTNGIVELRADAGWLSIQNTKITSWNPALNGPDIITNIYTQPRSYVHVASRLDPDGQTAHESRMDIINSEVCYLGWHSKEAYGLVWKVEDSTAQFIPPGSTNSIYDLVRVYGNIINSHLHNNCFGMYSYGFYGGAWVNNEVDHNLAYGFDPHNHSAYLDIENNNVHDNGWHGIIASVDCLHGVMRNNLSYHNGLDPASTKGNGLMLHRSSNFWLVENNQCYSNKDSGMAIFASENNIITNNIFTANGNAGMRLSVGARSNLVVGNQFINSGNYGLYLYQSDDLPYSPYENETIHSGQYYVTVGTNLFVADEPTARCQENIVSNNIINGSGLAVGIPTMIRVDNCDSNLFTANTILQPSSIPIGTNTINLLFEGTNNLMVGNTLQTNMLVTLLSSPTIPVLTIAATNGTIIAPFTITNGLVSQSVFTPGTNGGQALYNFTNATAGNYIVSAFVGAPSLSQNSFYVNIDKPPTNATMIWDIPLTPVLTNQTVSWQGTGNGNPTNSQFIPKVFNLKAGKHQLIFLGCASNTTLGPITITTYYGTNLASDAIGPLDSTTLTCDMPGEPNNLMSLEPQADSVGVFTDPGGAIFTITNSLFGPTNIISYPVLTNVVSSTGSVATVTSKMPAMTTSNITVHLTTTNYLTTTNITVYLKDLTVVRPDFFALPQTGSAQITVTSWDPNSDYKTWTVKGSSKTMLINYRVGDLTPGAFHVVTLGTTTIFSGNADAFGYLTFTSAPGSTAAVTYNVIP